MGSKPFLICVAVCDWVAMLGKSHDDPLASQIPKVSCPTWRRHLRPAITWKHEQDHVDDRH